MMIACSLVVTFTTTHFLLASA